MSQYRQDIKAWCSLSFFVPLLSFVCWIRGRLSWFIAEKKKGSSRPHFGTCIAQNKRRHCCLNIPGETSPSTLEWPHRACWRWDGIGNYTDWFCLEQACSIDGRKKMSWSEPIWISTPQQIRSNFEEEGGNGYPKIDSHLISFCCLFTHWRDVTSFKPYFQQ